MRRGLTLVIVLWGLLWAGAGLAEWRLYGQNTLRVEEYGARGNLAASPYSELGRHRYNEFSFNLDGGPNPYNQWRFQVSGVGNDSYYRSQYQDWVPERLYLSHQRGNGPLPFRFEAGDYYANISDLTMRRSVKGLRMELQPKQRWWGHRQSFVVFAGAQETSWMDFHADRNLYRGASWLWQGDNGSRYSLNVVHNTRRPDWHRAGFDQWVASLALYKPFEFARQKLVAEGEFAQFQGDPTYLNPIDERWEDTGLYAALSGQDTELPVSYSFRFERYGDQFQPAGASVSANRQTLYANAAWQFKGGQRIGTRWQRYTDYLESENPVNTDAVYLSINGPFPDPIPSRLSGGIEFGWRHRADHAETFRAQSSSVDADLALTLHQGSETEFSMRWYAFDDWSWPGTEQIVREASLSSDIEFEAGPLAIRAQPGITYRETDSTSLLRYWYPSLFLAAESDRHELSMRLGYSLNDTLLPWGIDVETYQASLSYEFHLKNHTLGVSYDHNLREPELGMETESWRAAAFWQYRFDHTFGADG